MRSSVTAAVCSGIECRNGPSVHAPPVAWAVARFVQLLVDEQGAIAPEETGLIVASDECSLALIRELSTTASQGKVSPLRFAGASPSIVVGLPALQLALRGPSLCLTMPPAHARAAVAALIRYWTRNNSVSAVIAVAHYRLDEDRHLLKGLVARAGDLPTDAIAELCDSGAGRDRRPGFS